MENVSQAEEVLRNSQCCVQGWQGFKIAAVGSEEEVFNNILAAKTVSEIPRAKKRRLEGMRDPLEPPGGMLRAQRTLLCSRAEKTRRRRRKLRRRKLMRRRKKERKKEKLRRKKRKSRLSRRKGKEKRRRL